MIPHATLKGYSLKRLHKSKDSCIKKIKNILCLIKLIQKIEDTRMSLKTLTA